MNQWSQSYKHMTTLPKAFWIMIASTFLNQIGNMGLVFLLFYLTHFLQMSLTEASFAFAVFSTAMIISGLIGGSLSDQWGSARLVVFSLIINGLILILFAYVKSYPLILLLCIGWGIFFGINRPASQSFISELSITGKYKLNFSIYRLAINLGMSIGPALGGYLTKISFPFIFTFNGITNLIASLILIIGLKNSDYLKLNKPKTKFKLNLKFLKEDKELRWFILGMIPLAMVFFQHESTLAVFLEKDLNIPITFYGWLFTINTLIIVFFELPLNVLTLEWSYRTHFMIGSFFITIGFFLLAIATKPFHIILLAISWTIGEMVFYPSATSYIADLAPSKFRGNYMAWYNSCSNIGMLLGPWGGAILMQHFGADILWIACGICGFISILIFQTTKQR